jgi:purine-nucleoside/S-methyl-5'-thioadenosine phosphorylase / adenosine deaminase
MGRRGEAGKRGSGEVAGTGGGASRDAQRAPMRAPFSSSELREAPVAGTVPRYEIPGWRERYGVVAGITGRGDEAGRGFDLGLWSKQPVGEVMSRWLAFRREMAVFPAVALGNQVHGVQVTTANTGPGWMQLEGIDGWISTQPGILLTVTIADCVPVYLVAPGRGVALLHAGWRGTAGGILRAGAERLRAETGSREADIIMHCGVGICGPCYEVGSEVMQGCGVPTEGAGPWHIDLRERLVEQAKALGIGLVTTSAWCSAHHRSLFYSHRASGGSDGRMVAYLGIAPLASNPHPE